MNTVNERIQDAIKMYEHDESRVVIRVRGDVFGDDDYRMDRIVYRGYLLEGHFVVALAPYGEDETRIQDRRIYQLDWLWLVIQNRRDGRAIPIRTGDVIVNQNTNVRGMVFGVGSIPFGRKRLHGYRVWLPYGSEDFFPSSDSYLFETSDEIAELAGFRRPMTNI